MFGLRSGVLIFLSIEALFWAIISFAAVYSEIKYINLVDIPEWSDEVERDWYYYLVFEHPRDLYTDKFRSKWKLLIASEWNSFHCWLLNKLQRT